MSCHRLWIALLISLPLGRCPAGDNPTPSGRDAPLDYVIVATGGELLEGVYPDAHTPFLTRTLRPLGCRCVAALVVGDQPEALGRALAFATNRAALVIVTGGLGPTPNDITRQTLADFTGIPLQEEPEVIAALARRFQEKVEQLRPGLRRQALVPRQGGHLKNENGTAVGLVFDAGGPVMVALPGPPRELQPMVQAELVPFLRRRFGVHDLGASLTLRFVGVGQSQITQTIQDHVPLDADVVVTSLFEGGRVDFTFALPGPGPAEQDRLQRLERDIRQHLEEFIYAADGSSLEEVVVRGMKRRGGTLALAEIASAGHLAAAFQDVAESGSVLAGGFVAPSLDALAGLLRMPPPAEPADGDPLLRTLALAVAQQTRCALVVAVGPATTAADGSEQAEVVFHFADREPVVHQVSLGGQGELRQASLTTAILDRMRRLLR